MFDLFRKHWQPGMVVAADVETTGLLPARDDMFGISLTLRNASGQLISEYEDVRGQEERIAEFLTMVFSQALWVVNHNIKFDAMFVTKLGGWMPLEKCICSQIRANLINENLHEYNLDVISKKYLKAEKLGSVYEDLARMFGGQATRAVQIKNLPDAPISTVAPYANKDTELAYRLWELQEKLIRDEELEQIDHMERRAFVELVKMEYNGIRVDLEEADRAKAKVDLQVTAMGAELKDLIGDVNPNSPKQLTNFFRPEKVGEDWFLPIQGKRYPMEKTKGGEPSWGKSCLQSLPMREAQLMIDIKSAIKTRDTFIGGHILEHEYKGRVYPSINQVKGDEGGTRTGRLSYTGPALQQIPARNKDVASVVRPIFLPEEGHRWVYGDLDQHEYRVFAHYAKSPKLIQAYRNNPDLDVHQFVADLTGIPRNMRKEGGANAKQLNLSIVFCMSDGRVAAVLGLPYKVEHKKDREGNIQFSFLKAGPETMAILNEYHKQFPGVKELQAKVKAKAKAQGHIRTILGRHLRFPRGKGVYKSPGLLFQASSGDLNKDNIVKVGKALKESEQGARLLLNIHDEYSMSIPEGEEHLISKVQAAIQDRKELRVPIRIDFGKPAANWWLATQKGQ